MLVGNQKFTLSVLSSKCLLDIQMGLLSGQLDIKLGTLGKIRVHIKNGSYRHIEQHSNRVGRDKLGIENKCKKRRQRTDQSHFKILRSSRE